MPQGVPQNGARARPVVQTSRFLLFAGLGAVVPCLFYYMPDFLGALTGPTGTNSTLASVIAAVVAAFALRKISVYHDVSAVRYLLPTFATTFGIAAAVLLVARLQQSNAILILGFGGSLLTAMALLIGSHDADDDEYHLIPGGRVERLFDLPTLRHSLLETPLAPRKAGVALVADLHHDLSPAWEHAIASAALGGTPVYHYKQVWEGATGRVQIEHLSENLFGSLLPSVAYMRIKRAVDIVSCVILIPLLIVPLLVVAVLIRLDSPGPALFRQTRIGFRGVPFDIYKFRTMRVASPGGDARATAMTQARDERITRLGAFLRRSRIDELPQMLNILSGDMSWIGPRPEAHALAEWYQAEIPFYAYRHIVRPGITGWAQVNQGHVTGLDDVDAKLQYDFYYIKYFSSWIDMLIAMRSIIVLITGHGAR